MSEFKKENLENIKSIFEEKTGVSLPERRGLARPVKTVLLLAALVACLSITAFAGVRFSSLQGDELSLNGVYEGGGIVAIEVENHSDKLLKFEEDFFLQAWEGGRVAVDMDKVRMENTEFAPGTKGVMRIDISEACDMAALEQPTEQGNWYYFLLTNDKFIFGQDWMCSVDFAPAADEPAPAPQPDTVAPSSGEDVREAIEESLRPYFENVTLDIIQRRQQMYEYIEAYTALLADFEGDIVSSVSPCLPGNRIDITQPLLTVTVPEIDGPAVSEYLFHSWRSVTADYRAIAAEGEYAYVVEANLPKTDGHTVNLPFIYILSYEADAVRDDAYAFVHGRLLTFAELEEYKVYEGEGKISYELSALVFDDPAEYALAVLAQEPGAEYAEGAMELFEKIYDAYKENLSSLISYKTAE